MSKYLLPFNNLLLRNKNNNSGGKNSTAKTVSVTYAMTNEEINKRNTYNAGIDKGIINVSYEQFAKTYTPKAVQNTSVLKGKTEITQPKLLTFAPVSPAVFGLPTLEKTGEVINGVHVPAMPKDWARQKETNKLLSVKFPTLSKTFDTTIIQSIWDAQLKVDTLKKAGKLPGSIELTKAEEELNNFKQDYVYSKQPTKSIDTLDLSSNEQIPVKTVTSEDLDAIQRSERCTRLQTIFLRNDEHYVCTTQTPWGAPEISTHYLSGLKENDTVVLFDTVTGQFYRFEQDTKESAAVKTKMEETAKRMQTTYDELESETYARVKEANDIAVQINSLIDASKTRGLSTAEENALSTLCRRYTEATNDAEYTAQYTAYMSKLSSLQTLNDTYTELQAQYDSFGLSDIVMNSEWKESMDANVKKINDARTAFKKYQDYYYSDMYSDTQINSLADAYRAYIGRTCFDDGEWSWKAAWNNAIYPTLRNFALAMNAVNDQRVYRVNEDPYEFVFSKDDEKLFEDIAKAMHRTWVRPFENLANEFDLEKTWTENLSALKTTGGMLLNNTLVNLGETLDVANMLAFKPGVIANTVYGNEELMKQAGVTQFYEDVLNLSEDQLPIVQDADGGRPITDLEGRRKHAFAVKMRDAYWGAYGNTPTYDYEMMWKEEDRNFGTFLAGLALDIFLDPSTYLTFGLSKLSEAGTMVDDVADLMETVIKSSDYADLLADIDVHRVAQQAVKTAIETNTKIDDVYLKALADEMLYIATEGGKVKGLIKNLPDKGGLSILKSKADDVHRAMTRLNITRESRGKAVRELRNQHMQAIYKDLAKIAHEPLETALGSSYKMINRMQNVYRAGNFIDSLAFDLVMPIKPIAGLAQHLRKGLRSVEHITEVSTFLGRVQNKWNKIIGKAEEVPLNKIDDMMDIVTKEMGQLTPSVFSIDEFNDIANATHRVIRSDAIDRYSNEIIRLLSTTEDAATRVAKLDELFVKLDIDGVTSVPELIRYLKKPIGTYNHSIYDMLDSSVIGKLRALQDSYKLAMYEVTEKKVLGLLDTLDNWKTDTLKTFETLANVPKTPDAVVEALTNDYNTMIRALDDSRKLYIDGVSKVSKEELFAGLRDVQQELANIYDAAISGDTAMSRVTLDACLDNVQDMFSKYADDIRDANTYNIYTMNKKVERKMFSKPNIPEDKKFISDKFIDGVREYLKGTYDADVPKDILSKELLTKVADLANKSTGSVEIADTLRTYVGMLSKSERALTYIADVDLVEAIEPFLSNRSAVDSFIRMVPDPDEGPLKGLSSALYNFRRDVITYSITRNITRQVAELDVEPAYIQGVLDALSGEHKYINRIWSKVDVLKPASVEDAVDSITDHLISTATQYLANKSNEDTKLFNVVIDGMRKRMCTLDTEHNVLEMVDAVKSIKGAFEYLAEDADKCYDVYFSIAKQNEHGDAFSITLHYETDEGFKTVTYRNKETIYNPTPNYVRYNHGITCDNAHAEFSAATVGKALSKEQFDEAVGNALKEIKHYASSGEQGNKAVRFIGFNNGLMGTNQDRTLNTFIRKNAITVHNDITVDLADFLRLERGIPVFNTETRAALHRVIRTNANSALAQGTNSLLSVFDTTFLVNAEALTKSLKVAGKELYALYPKAWVDSVINSMDNIAQANKNVAKKLDGMSEGFQDLCIREKAVVDLVNRFSASKHITSINVHALLENAMKLSDSNLTLNVQKLIDSTMYEYLYKLDGVAMYTSANKLYELRGLSNTLFDTIDRIRQPEIINSVGAAAYGKLLNAMLEELHIRNVVNDDYLGIIMRWLNDDNPMVMFSACRYVYTKYQDALKKVLDNKNIAKTNAFRSVKFADGIIFNESTKIFTLSDRLNYSKIYGEWTQHSQFLEDIRYFKEYSATVDNFTLYQAMQQALFDTNHVVTAAEQIAMSNFAHCAEPYLNLLKSFEVETATHKTGKVTKALDILEHSTEIEKRKNIIAQIGDISRTTALRTVFSLDDKEFFVYLVKDCKNGCIVDTACTMMQDPKVRGMVLDRINALEASGLFDVDRGADGIIKIFHDKARLKNADMDNFYRMLVDSHVDYATKYEEQLKEVLATRQMDDMCLDYFGKYTDARKAMQEYLPNHWVVSTFNANTQETAKNLQAFFPEQAHLDLSVMEKYGLFDESFTCSVWADAKVIRENDMIMYYSDDVVKSMGTGLYHVRNNAEAIKNKFTLYDNPTQSLNYIFNQTKIEVPDYKTFNKQLDLFGMTVHKGVIDERGMYHIKKITIDSDKALKACIADPKVICTPNDVFTEMVQFSKGRNRAVRVHGAEGTSKVLTESINLWQQKIRSARFTMWMFGNGIGAGLRNAVDATGKALLTTKDMRYFNYLKNAIEYINRFDEVYEKVLAYYPNGTTEDIIRFFSEHADEVQGMDINLMLNIFAHRSSSSSGSMISSIMGVKQSSNFGKLKELCKDTPEVTDEMLNKAMRIYQKEYNKNAHKVAQDFVIQKANVHDALKHAGIDGVALNKLTDLYYNYTPSSAAFSDWVRNIPGLFSILGKAKAPDATTTNKLMAGKSALSNYITMNANAFSAAEDYTRLGMFLYYTDELGYSVSKANQQVIKAQFDYSARPQWLENVELLFPFSTFKLYNAEFWLKEMAGQHGAIRTVFKFMNATGVGFDTEEIADLTRTALIREKIINGEIVLDEDGNIDEEASVDGVWTAMAQTVFGEEGVINLYRGQERMYAELAGGIPIGRYHVLKTGNTFIEALNLINSGLLAVPQIMNGQIPDLFKDNVYSPLWTVFSGLTHMANNGWTDEAFAEWYSKNYHAANDFIPFLGSLYNLAITHMKNGKVNMQDIWTIVTNPQLKDEYLRTIGEQFLCVAGTVLPSFVGTIYEDYYWDRPIGYDWYNQTQEYKDTHRFVFGVSYVPTFYAKNPATYINYMAMYERLGYTTDEALEILNALYGRDDSEAPVKWVYNQELFDETLKYLISQGYKMSEALDILMDKNLWERKGLGNKLADVQQASMLNNSVFYKMYDRLPDYIKYTDGQYSALRSYYASKGYNEGQIYAAMLYGNGFIDVKGNYVTVTPEQAERMNTEVNNAYYEFITNLPEWYRYEDGAATRTINYLKDAFGMNTQQARDYIIANNFYVDVNGVAKKLSAEEVAERTKKNKEDFNKYYSSLPSAIKYEKGAYGRTLKYLVQVEGISEDEAKKLIQGGMYLTLDGQLIDCTDIERVKQYNVWASNQYGAKYAGYIRTYAPRPKRVRKRYIKQARARRPYKMRGNNSMTYSLVNVRNGANFGTRNAYKTTLGYNSASAILSTKGNYPQTWRNVAQAYRRNMYKEHYAKYGMSRIDMRSGVWKGYSNASVTRLRRENLYAARRYRNRRVF